MKVETIYVCLLIGNVAPLRDFIDVSKNNSWASLVALWCGSRAAYIIYMYI